MSAKLDIKTIIILILISLLVYDRYFDTPEPDPKPVVITIPEKSGVKEKKLDSIKTDTVFVTKYLPGKELSQKVITIVDSTYKAKYEAAVKENDSLTAKNLFLQSIEINEYNESIEDNDSIKINGYFKTRGKLLDYKISWTIPKTSLTYKPEVVKLYPKLSLIAGGELIIPSDPMFNAGFKMDIGVQTHKGDIFSIGRDTNGNYYFGYKRSFRILK